MTEEKNHTFAGDANTTRHPAKFIKTPAKAVPVQGQHSQEVLEQVGYDQEVLASLMAGGPPFRRSLAKGQ